MGLLAEAENRWAVACAAIAISVLAGTGSLTSSLIVLSTAVLMCVAIAVVSPLGALCAVMATLPWFYQPLELGDLEFALSELLLASAVAGAPIRLMLETGFRHRTVADLLVAVRNSVTSRVPVILGTLAIVGLSLSLWPNDPSHRADSLREWRWVLAEPLLMLVLLGLFARNLLARKLIAVALIAGVSIASAQAFLDLVGDGGVAVEGVTRISGPFPHPNALALMTTRVAALAISWMILDRSVRRVLGVPMMIAVVAVVATFSRGAWASLTASVLLSGTRLGTRARHIVLASPVAIALAAIALASERMLSLFDGGSGSLRLSIWSSAIAMIRDRPIRGYGPDQFLHAYLPRYVEPEAWQERFSSHAHNLILDFWIRLGIIGCAFAIGVVIVCLVAAVGVVRRSTTDDALASAAVIAVVAFVIHGLVDDAYFSHELAMSGWLLAWLAFPPGGDGAVEGARGVASPRFRRRGVHRIASVRQSSRRRL